MSEKQHIAACDDEISSWTSMVEINKSFLPAYDYTGGL